MQLTHHARTRMQQRAIPKSVLNLLYTYGREVEQGHRASLIYFDRRARDSIRKMIPRREYVEIDQKLNAYLVEGSDGSVLTVGYRYKPLRG